LDLQVRQRLRHEVRQILKRTGISAIFVTHDQEEALAISDRIGVMRQGKLEQLGTPEAIYTSPNSRFVAEFVTQANFLPARRQGNTWQTDIGSWEILPSCAPQLSDKGELMLRQEDIALQPDATAPVVIRERQFLGREYRYCLETASGKRLHARTTASTQLPIGTHVRLSVTPQAAQIFPSSIS
jgi:iron(III) transport system ATP-binding protein